MSRALSIPPLAGWLDPGRWLDPEALLARLAPALGTRAARLLSARVTYARAKRGTSATLGLALRWESGGATLETLGSLYFAADERLRDATAKAKTLRLVEPGVGPTVAWLPAPGAFYLAFPNDRAMRGLSAAADPRRLINRLRALGAASAPPGLRVSKRGSRVDAVRWKPGRRAVLHARLGLREASTERPHPSPLDLYLRVYPMREMERSLARWRAAADLPGVGAPRVAAIDRERGWFAVEALDGCPPQGPAHAPETWPRIASLLRALHGSWLTSPGLWPHRSDVQELEAATRALADLAEWAPQWSALAADTVSRLALAGRRLDEAPVRPIHGDLSIGQVLIGAGGAALLDWDEASRGDPHADLASLAVDQALRDRGPSALLGLEPLAAELLGRAFQENRWRWQVALAHARRCLAGLQAGGADWLERAGEALEAARSWCPRTPRPGRASGHARAGRATVETASPGSSTSDAASVTSPGATLRALLDPTRRAAVTGVEGRSLRLTAVWPDQDGAIARLEAPGKPGPPLLWLRIGRAVEAWPFPRDPALDVLAPLVERGDRVLGHRFARRATLCRPGVPREILHLRSPAAAARSHERVAGAFDLLSRAGVRSARPGRFHPRLSGWGAEAMPGATLDPTLAPTSAWADLGRLLARVHAIEAVDRQVPHGLTETVRAARRQIALVAGLEDELGRWLERSLEATATAANASAPARASLVHGDLHPAQILLDRGCVILDWEQAGAGDPESDLGNLAAHLFWAMGPGGEAPWRVLASSYARQGGRIEAPRLVDYARVALLRVLAIHSWRDCDRARCLDTALWQRWPEEISRWSNAR